VIWSRAILNALGAQVEYSGLENRPLDQPCVFVANHQSNADIWAVVPALPLDTKFVAKASLFRWPFLGRAMRRAGFVAIDRSQRRSAIESLRAAATVITGGCPVILFPEGTRSRSGELRPFKKGPFHLALQAAVPLVPVMIDGSWEILRPGEWRARPGTIRVRFLTPVSVDPFLPGDHDGLRREVHRRIAAALTSAGGADERPRDGATPAGSR
jgi:1-acyl-sn-glycerol-3-phosphate acyltransferase